MLTTKSPMNCVTKNMLKRINVIDTLCFIDFFLFRKSRYASTLWVKFLANRETSFPKLRFDLIPYASNLVKGL